MSVISYSPRADGLRPRAISRRRCRRSTDPGSRSCCAGSPASPRSTAPCRSRRTRRRRRPTGRRPGRRTPLHPRGSRTAGADGRSPTRRTGCRPAPARGLAAHEVGPDGERLRQPVRRGLLGVGQVDAESRPVAQQPLELRSVTGGGDDQDVLDAGQQQRRQRVVDHRLVVDRHELLADPEGDGVQPRAASAGQDDPAHVGERAGP